MHDDKIVLILAVIYGTILGLIVLGCFFVLGHVLINKQRLYRKYVKRRHLKLIKKEENDSNRE